MRRLSIACNGVLLGLVAYLIGSEVYWLNHIAPKDSQTLDEFQRRFKDQLKVSDLTRSGRRYTIASGSLPPFYIFSFPSSPPIYVFEDSGRLVDWAADIGDQNPDSSFRIKWITPE